MSLAGLLDRLRGGWVSGAGQAPEGEYPQGTMVLQHWSQSGEYTLRALGPMERFRLKFMLTGLLGAELLAAAHDLMVLAAAVEEPSAVNFRRIYDTMRRFAARGEPLDREAVSQAAGDLWEQALRRMYELMPEERVLDLPDFLGKTRRYFAALGPILSAVDDDKAMAVVRQLLLVRRDGGPGLYVRGRPCRDDDAVNALIPHDDLPAIAFWALLFNLRPFTHAGRSTAPSPGHPPKGNPPAPPSRAPTPSTPGRATGSSTSTATPPNRSKR